MLNTFKTGVLPEIRDHLRGRFQRRSQDALKVFGIPSKQDLARIEERTLKLERWLDSLARRIPRKGLCS